MKKVNLKKVVGNTLIADIFFFWCALTAAGFCDAIVINKF